MIEVPILKTRQLRTNCTNQKKEEDGQECAGYPPSRQKATIKRSIKTWTQKEVVFCLKRSLGPMKLPTTEYIERNG